MKTVSFVDTGIEKRSVLKELVFWRLSQSEWNWRGLIDILTKSAKVTISAFLNNFYSKSAKVTISARVDLLEYSVVVSESDDSAVFQ